MYLKKIYECLQILFVSGVCAFIYNAFSPNGIALVGEWDTTKGVVSAVSKSNPVIHDIEIDTVEEAKTFFDESQTLFVDARPFHAFDEGHIKGAFSLPLASFDDVIERFFESYPFSTRIVTYCSGRECQDSHELARLLMEIGYSDVLVFIDGYPLWKNNGYPVEGNDGAGDQT